MAIKIHKSPLSTEHCTELSPQFPVNFWRPLLTASGNDCLIAAKGKSKRNRWHYTAYIHTYIRIQYVCVKQSHQINHSMHLPFRSRREGDGRMRRERDGCSGEKERAPVPEKLRIIHGALRLKELDPDPAPGFRILDSDYLSSTAQFSGEGNYFGSPTPTKWPTELGPAEWIWPRLSRWTDGWIDAGINLWVNVNGRCLAMCENT